MVTKRSLRTHLQKKMMGRAATSDRRHDDDGARDSLRDSLPVAHVPCVRALRGSTGRVGVAAAFQRRHGRIVTAAQVIASNGPPCALLHPRRSPSLVGRAHGSMHARRLRVVTRGRTLRHVEAGRGIIVQHSCIMYRGWPHARSLYDGYMYMSVTWLQVTDMYM